MTITINGTTGISGVDGSAGTPALQGSDTNTGVYFGTDLVYIATGGTAAVTVDSGQRTKFPTTIGVGAATPSTSGSGVSFPATQSASTDANTLDDYEEGTWTPVVTGSTSAGTVTYTYTRRATYTKIGRLVEIEMDIGWSSGTGTGNLVITGLPFTVSNSPTLAPAANVPYFDGLTLTASNIVAGLFVYNTTTIEFRNLPVGGGSATALAYDSAVAQLIVSGTYIV